MSRLLNYHVRFVFNARRFRRIANISRNLNRCQCISAYPFSTTGTSAIRGFRNPSNTSFFSNGHFTNSRGKWCLNERIRRLQIRCFEASPILFASRVLTPTTRCRFVTFLRCGDQAGLFCSSSHLTRSFRGRTFVIFLGVAFGV